MQRRALVLAAVMGGSLACSRITSPVRLVLIGDSTVADYPPSAAPMAGWGQALRDRLRHRAEVVNHAVPGAGTRRFVDTHWPRVRSRLAEGDWLLMQFGHVDALPAAEVHAAPDGAYRSLLLQMVDQSRAARARPILVTPVSRYAFEAGRVLDTHGDYPASMRKVARETGALLLDLGASSASAMERVGAVAARSWFMISRDGRDGTHLTMAGAEAVAQLVEAALVEARVIETGATP